MDKSRTLPPLVRGKVRGFLNFSVDEVTIFRNILFLTDNCDIVVQIQWWGEVLPSYIRPQRLHIEKNHKKQDIIQNYSTTYEIKTSLDLFKSYLKTCEVLELAVLEAVETCVIGSAFLKDLISIINNNNESILMPLIDCLGEKIGEIKIHFNFTESPSMTNLAIYTPPNTECEEIVEATKDVTDRLNTNDLFAMEKIIYGFEKSKKFNTPSSNYEIINVPDKLNYGQSGEELYDSFKNKTYTAEKPSDKSDSTTKSLFSKSNDDMFEESKKYNTTSTNYEIVNVSNKPKYGLSSEELDYFFKGKTSLAEKANFQSKSSGSKSGVDAYEEFKKFNPLVSNCEVANVSNKPKYALSSEELDYFVKGKTFIAEKIGVQSQSTVSKSDGDVFEEFKKFNTPSKGFEVINLSNKSNCEQSSEELDYVFKSKTFVVEKASDKSVSTSKSSVSKNNGDAFEESKQFNSLNSNFEVTNVSNKPNYELSSKELNYRSKQKTSVAQNTGVQTLSSSKSSVSKSVNKKPVKEKIEVSNKTVDQKFSEKCLPEVEISTDSSKVLNYKLNLQNKKIKTDKKFVKSYSYKPTIKPVKSVHKLGACKQSFPIKHDKKHLTVVKKSPRKVVQSTEKPKLTKQNIGKMTESQTNPKVSKVSYTRRFTSSGEKVSTNHSHFQDIPSKEYTNKKVLDYLLGSDMSKEEEERVLKDFKNMSPSHNLVSSISQLCTVSENCSEKSRLWVDKEIIQPKMEYVKVNGLNFDLSNPIERNYFEMFFAKSNSSHSDFEIAQLLNQPENSIMLEKWKMNDTSDMNGNNNVNAQKQFESINAQKDVDISEFNKIRRKDQYLSPKIEKDFSVSNKNELGKFSNCARCKYYKKLEELDTIIESLKHFEKKLLLQDTEPNQQLEFNRLVQ